MKQILIFTLTFLLFGIVKAIIDQIPVLVTTIFISVAILFTYELVQLLKKEKKNRGEKTESVMMIDYKWINIRKLRAQKNIVLPY